MPLCEHKNKIRTKAFFVVFDVVARKFAIILCKYIFITLSYFPVCISPVPVTGFFLKFISNTTGD